MKVLEIEAPQKGWKCGRINSKLTVVETPSPGKERNIIKIKDFNTVF